MSKPLTDKDGEVRELTETDFAQMKPVAELLPDVVKAARGRPKSDNPKRSITLRLDPDVLEYFQKNGKGWQTRINKALVEYIENH